MALSKADIQRLKTNSKAVPNKLYIEEPDRNGRSNYYIGTNDNRVRIITQAEYNSIVNPVTPVVNNITTGTTSVGATSPITSIGGATPTISTSMATNKLIGRGTVGTGVMEEIILGTNLSLTGTTLNASGGGGGLPIATAAGAVDVITATYSPALTLSDKVVCAFVATGANTTTTPTFNADGLGAKTIVKQGGQALVAGDIPNALTVCILEYNLANTRWELLNPSYQTQLALKAPLASPALTGNPTAPTPTSGDNDTSIATTAFVTNSLAIPTVGSNLYLFYNLS